MKFCVVLTLCLSGVLAFAEPEMKNKDISAVQAASVIAKNDELVIIDVRTPKEYAEGHLKGAMNINIKDDSFEDELAKLDRSKTYLIHCKSGRRSSRAMEVFKKLDFQKALHMKDGFLGWTAAQQPVVK